MLLWGKAGSGGFPAIPTILLHTEISLNLYDLWLGMVAHTCGLNILGGQGGQIIRGQGFETSLANVVKPRLY